MARKGGMATGVEVARISVKVSPDTKQFRKDLQQDLNEIERTMKGNIEVKAHLDRAQAKADFDTFMAKLKAEGKKGVKIKADVVEGKTSAGGGGSRNKNSNRDDLSLLGKIMSKVKSKVLDAPSFGSGINLTGYLIILTALSAVLSPLAGLLTGLLLTLPGLISLILTPIAALALGMDGLKKAAETLKGPFDSLKATMSQATQDQFTPVFEKLRAIFPSLEAALPAVTQGLSQMLAGVVNTVTSGEGLASIEKTIFQIGGALQGLSPGFQSLAHALMGLVETFTGGPLQGLVQWFNGAMASFDNWVTKAKESGQLETIFNRVGEALKFIVDIFGKIAALGIDTITDPEKWNAFMGVLKAAGYTLLFFFVLSDQFLQKLVALGHAWDSLKAAVGGVMSAILTFGANAAGMLSSAWAGISTGATAVWEAIKFGAANMVAAVITFFGELPSKIANFISDAVAKAGAFADGLISAAQAAWDGFSAAVQNGISIVIGFVSAMPGQILSALGDLAGLLVNAGKAAMDGLLNGIKAGAQAVYDFVSGIAGKIASLKGPIPKDKVILVPNGEALMQGLGKGLENGFQPVLDQAKTMAGQIAEAFATGADPTQFTEGFTGKEVSRMSKTLGLESKRMGLQAKALDYQAKMAGKGAMADQLKAQADAIRLKKEELDLQREMLDLTKEYAQAGTDTQAGGTQQIQDLLNMPLDFVKANVNQAMQDVGISGQGFLPTVANTALDWGSKFIFNVSNMDEALSAQQTLTNRQSLGIL